MIKILTSLLLGSLLCTAQSSYTLTLSKQKAYVGEPLTATLMLESNSTEAIHKIHYKPLKLEGYKIIPFPNESGEQKSRHFLLFSHFPGSRTLTPQQIEVAHKDPRTYRNIWQTLKTPPVTLTILPLPAGVQTVGNYTLQSTIDHQRVQSNKPLNLTVTIKGKGSLESVKPWQLKLKDALVFESKPQIHGQIINGVYQSTLTQTFAIIAEKDFILPSIQWKYLNSDTGLIETLSTPSYQIQVTGAAQKREILTYTGLILLGLLLGILLSILVWRFRNRTTPPDTPLSKQIRNNTSDKKLYHILLPYADDDTVSEILGKLEENLNQGAGHTIDRSDIAKRFK